MVTMSPPALELLQFADELATASTVDELEKRYHDGVTRFAVAPMRSLYLLDPATGARQRCATVGVSEVFLERYEAFGRPDDPVHAYLLRSGKATTNLALVGWEAWSRTDAYLRCSRLHRMVGIVYAPIVIDGRVAGNIHLAREDGAAAPGPEEVRMGELLGRIVAIALQAVRSRESLERRCNEALRALDLVSTPIVLTAAERTEPYPNAAAREILAAVPDSDDAIYALITPPPGEHGAFERELAVELRDGARAVLHGRTRSVEDGRLITVLRLDDGRAHLLGDSWVALTTREREVAALVAEDHTDADIAAILVLSTHTVNQYVKNIYRKLGVSSRVGLTRLVLQRQDAPGASGPPQS